MGRVAEEGGAPLDPRTGGIDDVDREFLPWRRRADQGADLGTPVAEAFGHEAVVGPRRPARLVEGLLDDGDDVDRSTMGDGVVDEMGLRTEPEADPVGRERWLGALSIGITVRQAVRPVGIAWRDPAIRARISDQTPSAPTMPAAVSTSLPSFLRARTKSVSSRVSTSSIRAPSIRRMSDRRRTAAASTVCRSARWITR